MINTKVGISSLAILGFMGLLVFLPEALVTRFVDKNFSQLTYEQLTFSWFEGITANKVNGQFDRSTVEIIVDDTDVKLDINWIGCILRRQIAVDVLNIKGDSIEVNFLQSDRPSSLEWSKVTMYDVAFDHFHFKEASSTNKELKAEDLNLKGSLAGLDHFSCSKVVGQSDKMGFFCETIVGDNKRLLFSELDMNSKPIASDIRLIYEVAAEELAIEYSDLQEFLIDHRYDLTLDGAMIRITENCGVALCEADKDKCYKPALPVALQGLDMPDILKVKGRLVYDRYEINGERGILRLSDIDCSLAVDSSDSKSYNLLANVRVNSEIPVQWSMSYRDDDIYDYTVTTTAFPLASLNSILTPAYPPYFIESGRVDLLELSVHHEADRYDASFRLEYDDLDIDSDHGKWLSRTLDELVVDLAFKKESNGVERIKTSKKRKTDRSFFYNMSLLLKEGFVEVAKINLLH